MHFQMIFVPLLAFAVQQTFAKGYGSGTSMTGGYQSGNSQPIPYNMGYETSDEQGNVQFRKEEGDGNGNVKGTYGYQDTQGLYRTVQYVAGSAGFRAAVQTNEPGTDGKENPADVQMKVIPAPAGLQEQFGRQSRGMGYRQGGQKKSGY